MHSTKVSINCGIQLDGHGIAGSDDYVLHSDRQYSKHQGASGASTVAPSKLTHLGTPSSSICDVARKRHQRYELDLRWRSKEQSFQTRHRSHARAHDMRDLEQIEWLRRGMRSSFRRRMPVGHKNQQRQKYTSHSRFPYMKYRPSTGVAPEAQPQLGVAVSIVAESEVDPNRNVPAPGVIGPNPLSQESVVIDNM
jgi:hypothetical protein